MWGLFVWVRVQGSMERRYISEKTRLKSSLDLLIDLLTTEGNMNLQERLTDTCLTKAAFSSLSGRLHSCKEATTSIYWLKGCMDQTPWCETHHLATVSRKTGPGVSNNNLAVQIQWNPDFSNIRLFETPDSSNHKSFPLDLLQSNTVILHPIFRMRDFSKLPIFWTNSFFLSKIFIRFLELWKRRNQQKPVLATYTPECN